MDEELEKKITGLFTEAVLLSFWTHEHCPPDKPDEYVCPTDIKGKHQPCMPCWKEWIGKLVSQILIIIKEAGYKSSDEIEFMMQRIDLLQAGGK